MTVDGGGIAAGLAAACTESSDDGLTDVGAATSGVTAGAFASASAVEGVGFAVADAGAGFSAPSAGDGATETVATSFFSTVACAESELPEAGGRGIFE